MKAVLIGGGSISNKDEYYLDEIDKEIIKFTNKDKINFLFVGFASSHSESNYENIKKKYKNLGCDTYFLKRGNLVRNYDLAVEKIRKADIIYFCGGDTLKLLDDITEFKLENEFLSAFQRGCVMVGLSAGAIILSNEGLSDSYILRGESDKYKFIKGFGFVDISICPHYHTDEVRDLEVLNHKKEVYGLENYTMILIDNNKLSFYCSNGNHIYKIGKKEKIIM